jgi:hypothetical protein
LADPLVSSVRTEAPDGLALQAGLRDGQILPLQPAQASAHRRLALSGLAERVPPRMRRKTLARRLESHPLLPVRDETATWRLLLHRDATAIAQVA